MARSRVLDQVEARLAHVEPRVERKALARWQASCPELTGPGRLAELPEWVWNLDRATANTVLAGLVGLAQDGDELALMAVLACLRPGLLSIHRRRPVRGERVTVDDIVAVAAARVLELPLARRKAIASGILLDVWNELWGAARRQQRQQSAHEALRADPRWRWGGVAEPSAGETALAVVAAGHRARAIDLDDARLLIETRLLGTTMQEAADHRGIPRITAYRRCWRSQAALAAHTAA